MKSQKEGTFPFSMSGQAGSCESEKELVELRTLFREAIERKNLQGSGDRFEIQKQAYFGLQRKTCVELLFTPDEQGSERELLFEVAYFVS